MNLRPLWLSDRVIRSAALACVLGAAGFAEARAILPGNLLAPGSHSWKQKQWIEEPRFSGLSASKECSPGEHFQAVWEERWDGEKGGSQWCPQKQDRHAWKNDVPRGVPFDETRYCGNLGPYRPDKDCLKSYKPPKEEKPSCDNNGGGGVPIPEPASLALLLLAAPAVLRRTRRQ